MFLVSWDGLWFGRIVGIQLGVAAGNRRPVAAIPGKADTIRSGQPGCQSRRSKCQTIEEGSNSLQVWLWLG